ncbi:MAG TPA: LON peptidase substrate-binding domain-containing protein [Candidatus Dormibacteraeota bacterium]|jgi:Lon protease-like protein|nr:LON peptidase substrate-binding domain-containing protein [Candidatus Dormibacteraeota bacterium]
MAIEVPLFPLGTVLFPHMPLSLHIFEERYKTMMRDCRRASTTFGIVAIRSGQETGGSAVPYEVGTLAQLDEIEELADGGFNLVVVGASRFHIDAFSHHRPYLVGSVHYLQDLPTPANDTDRLAAAVTVAFRGYAGQLRGIGQEDPVEFGLPSDPELLSYLVAAAMQVETAQRQRLLEIDGTAERLAACLRLLRREAALLDRMLVRSKDHAGTSSLN